MPRLIRLYLRFMLKRKPNVIQPVEQTVPDELIDRKLRPESLIVPHVASLQIDRHLVVDNLLGSLYQLRNFVLGQPHGKESILGAVVGEDIGKRRRDHSPKAEVRSRPRSVAHAAQSLDSSFRPRQTASRKTQTAQTRCARSSSRTAWG